jgi:hypothetical protein
MRLTADLEEGFIAKMHEQDEAAARSARREQGLDGALPRARHAE